MLNPETNSVPMVVPPPAEQPKYPSPCCGVESRTRRLRLRPFRQALACSSCGSLWNRTLRLNDQDHPIEDLGWKNTGTAEKREINGDHVSENEWADYLAHVLAERPHQETWHVTLSRRTAVIER